MGEIESMRGWVQTFLSWSVISCSSCWIVEHWLDPEFKLSLVGAAGGGVLPVRNKQIKHQTVTHKDSPNYASRNRICHSLLLLSSRTAALNKKLSGRWGEFRNGKTVAGEDKCTAKPNVDLWNKNWNISWLTCSVTFKATINNVQGCWLYFFAVLTSTHWPTWSQTHTHKN